MSLRPVYLTGLIRKNPPFESVMILDSVKRAIYLRNATLGCALYLAKIHQYLLMQDRGGGIWVQHRDCRYIVPPPGGSVFHVRGIAFPFQGWLGLIHRLVRMEGRVALDPKVPFKYSVQKLYDEHHKNNKPTTFGEPLSKRSTLKALNPYIAHRAWISKFLGGLGFTQMLISALTKGLWQREKRKAMWSNIARMYTSHRDDGTLTTTLEDFIKAQLIENKQDPSPRSFLSNCGINIDNMRKRMVPTCVPPNDQTSAIGTVEPTEQTYSDIHDIPTVHFQAPTVPDSSTMEYNKVEPILLSPTSTIFRVSKGSASTRPRLRNRKLISRSELRESASQHAIRSLPTQALAPYEQPIPDQILSDLPQNWRPIIPVSYDINQLDPRLCSLTARLPLTRSPSALEKAYQETETCLEKETHLRTETHPEPETYTELETYSKFKQYQDLQACPQPKTPAIFKPYTNQESYVLPQTYTAPNICPEPCRIAPEAANPQVPHGIYNPQNKEAEENFDFTKENTYFISEIYTSENFPQPQLQAFQQFSSQEHTTLRRH
uniref:MAT1-1-1 protein n=4 Tax=Morchella TaxID=5193 RepID=A0A7T7FRI3_9PEZI|nr:MAT1-1-1 protein [Morchella sp. Mes-6]